jgi:regulator of sigma E protease
LATLSTVYAIVMVALGLGFVIFIHELGHFLLAKWNDVKVEKFSIGFGPTLFGFRRGETEYVIAAIPLGGFVKMLGEGEGTTDDQARTTDPRAYPNKSVGARMAIITAGVIMNVILGLACFVYAYGHGMEAIPAKVGAVAPASPAYRAGMRPGDEIVAIDGRRDIKFTTLQLKVSLSSHDQVLRFAVRRPVRDGLIEMDIKPIREAKIDHPTIGILPAAGPSIATFQAPTGMLNPPAYPGLDRAKTEEFIDTLAAAGPAGKEPTPLAAIEDYERIVAGNLEKPITHVIERRSGSAREDGPVRERFELTLPPAHFVDFGMRLTIEPISAIQAGSPAEAAGFREGDRIIKVEGSGEFDPMRLPSLCHRGAGRPMTFEVERTAADGGRKAQTITVTPDVTATWAEPLLGRDLDVPALGLCYPVSTRVVAVTPDSPAARAGIKPGDVINSMTLKRSKTAKGSGGKSDSSDRTQTLKFEEGASSWVVAFGEIQALSDLDIELVVNKATQPIRIQPERASDWYYPSRGLGFATLRTRMPPQPIGSALRLGYEDTVENILSIYAMFRSLATGRVGFSGLGGVITISRVAFSLARLGLTYLIYFLGILSINLAVLNFLPVPPLDGGQMVFLIAEKVRGRPLPESAVAAVTYLGFALVLALMIFVNFQDIFRLF